jgi:hypothetical protein
MEQCHLLVFGQVGFPEVVLIRILKTAPEILNAEMEIESVAKIHAGFRVTILMVAFEWNSRESQRIPIHVRIAQMSEMPKKVRTVIAEPTIGKIAWSTKDVLRKFETESQADHCK